MDVCACACALSNARGLNRTSRHIQCERGYPMGERVGYPMGEGAVLPMMRGRGYLCEGAVLPGGFL